MSRYPSTAVVTTATTSQPKVTRSAVFLGTNGSLESTATDAFRRTPVRDFGNSGLNYLYGPGVNNRDFSISKRIPLGSEQRFINFRTELYNTWNYTQFSGLDSTFRFDPQGVNQNPNVGAYSSARGGRIIQLSLKVFF